MSRHINDIRPTYRFNETPRDTVPQAIRAFLDADDFKGAIRNAISLGGVPAAIKEQVYTILDDRLGDITRRFMGRYCRQA